jgi:hypothetical protein
MVANLECILGGITESPGSTNANPNYNPGTLIGTLDYMQEFSKINPKTTEGLKKYEELTGSKTKKVFRNDINLKYKQTKEELDERFTEYINAHIKPIIGEIPEIGQANIGYTFCPEQESTSKKYEATRRIVSTSKQKIKTIEEDPEKYIQEIIAAAPAFMKNIVGRHPDQVCAIDKQNAQMEAFASITKYGSVDFVADTYNHQISLEKEIKEESKKISKERLELEKKMKPGMYSQEEAKYFASINEKETKLAEKASKIMSPEELRSAILENAINSIKEKASKK